MQPFVAIVGCCLIDHACDKAEGEGGVDAVAAAVAEAEQPSEGAQEVEAEGAHAEGVGEDAGARRGVADAVFSFTTIYT